MDQTSTALVPTGAGPVDLDTASRALAERREAGDADTIGQVRAAAEAQAVYERAQGNAEEARKYATLKILAEAELGALLLDKAVSVDDMRPVPGRGAEQAWKVLAAAHEREALMEECEKFDGAEITTSAVVKYLRNCGYWRTPATSKVGPQTWPDARRLARGKGIPLPSLPPDRQGRAREIKRARSALRARNKAAWAAYHGDPNRSLREDAESRDKQAQPELERAYSLLRRTLQTCDKAQVYCGGEARRPVSEAMAALYVAEERILEALGKWVPPSKETDAAARLDALIAAGGK